MRETLPLATVVVDAAHADELADLHEVEIHAVSYTHLRAHET